MLSKLEELKFLNEGTNLSALKSIDNVLDRKMKTLNPEYVASIISTIVPEAEDIKLNPIRFSVETTDGLLTVKYEKGKVTEWNE